MENLPLLCSLKLTGNPIAPVVVPDWIANLATLAAYLSWASFSSRIPVAQLSLTDLAEAHT